MFLGKIAQENFGEQAGNNCWHRMKKQKEKNLIILSVLVTINASKWSSECPVTSQVVDIDMFDNKTISLEKLPSFSLWLI